MNIVIDEKIPYLRPALEAMGHNVVALPGVGISRADVACADALFVRTRTKCDASLLSGSKVRFIATATIGYDHIDAAFCAENGIEWHSAAGCNAGAVLQYVQSSLYEWSRNKCVPLEGLTIGVVGVGEIGSKVALWAREAGMKVLLNDPPRAAREGGAAFCSLDEIAAGCDVITFHPTLSNGGSFPSCHLADERFFASLKRCRLLLNASRGPVVDNKALLAALECGAVGDAVLDVWEGEPALDLSLLNKVYIATPHIAGYSAEGKFNATRMVLEAFAAFSGYENELPMEKLPSPDNSVVSAISQAEAMLEIYSPLADTVALKRAPENFEDLRNNYVLRREPCAFELRINGQ